jgi:nucleoside-diphosphate-sugar epimerase
MRVLIVGCGYVGVALGAELVRQGHEVSGLRRADNADATLRAAGIQPLPGDITQPEQLRHLPSGFDWVVNTVSSSKGGADDYRKVYVEGTRNLIEWLAPAPPRKFLYTSSTGVYGQDDGSSVKESSPTEPTSETGRLLVETENLLLNAARERKFPAIILRVAGIYGPDRTHFLRQYLDNEAKIPSRGERFMNMIHRDDLVNVIITTLKNGRSGEVYNAVDDEPVAQIHFFRWLSETLGKWMPPFATEDASDRSKRAVTNKKVLNRRLKMELGCQLRYPTFRQGYTAEIQRMEQAGELDIQPESRSGLEP